MPLRVQPLRAGPALLIQYCRGNERRVLDERIAADPLDGIRQLVLMVASMEDIRPGNCIKIKSA